MLDEGIAQIAREIEAGLPEGRRVAVVNFQSPSAYFSDYVLKELQIAFDANKHLNVLDRANLELRRRELDFQMSGEVSDESAVGIGHALGAQVIITGDFTDIGGEYRCRFYAIDVRTTEQQVSAAVTVRRDRTVAFMLPAEAAPGAQVPAKSDPLLATVYFNSGFTHYEAKRYAEAAADFTRALEIRKDDEAALRYRAHAYYYLNDYNKAIPDLNRLIEMQPDNAEYYLNRSAAYGGKGEWDKVIADCNQLIRFKPNQFEPFFNRAAAHLFKEGGNTSQAIADYTEAIRLNPYYAASYRQRAVAYARIGNYDRAIADSTKSISLDPSDPVVYMDRARSYLNKDDYSHCKADLEKALQLDPNNDEAQIILELLRQMGH
ncbi:MAG: tetratricopeptide repeat protein [Treponema sp.]|nr:tetratricopeptide repeat protein [Treponema sp.]